MTRRERDLVRLERIVDTAARGLVALAFGIDRHLCLVVDATRRRLRRT